MTGPSAATPGPEARPAEPGWLALVASLPLPVLYALTGALTTLMRWFGIRREIVRGNLAACFPELPAQEIDRLVKAHYSHVGQMAAEAFKAARLSPEELSQRVTMTGVEQARAALAAGKPILLIASHQANWEWVLHGLALNLGYPLDVGYKPIRSPWAERAMRYIRTRFGARLIPAKELLPDLLRRRSVVRGIAMLADQGPTSADFRHWVTFLGRETAFYMGAEKMAQATRYATFFVGMKRTSKGHYALEFVPLAAAGEKLPEGELTERYARLVEAEIRGAPADWTWTHRRWRMKPPLYGERTQSPG
jgi:Kdo2-lipid IVA lauroyltransferase/acyltransferase